MKRHVLTYGVALSIVVGSVGLGLQSRGVSAAPPEAAALSAKPALGDGPAEARYAWYLFIQAMTPSSGPGGPLAFESWTEQCQLNPAMIGCPSGAAAQAKGRLLHGSALAKKSSFAKAAAAVPGIECNPMAQGKVGSYPVPANVAPNASFCEEVFVNPAESAFVTQNGLTTLSGQQKYGSTQGGAITFPWEAVEIKADWVPVSSYLPGKTFACPDPTGSLYTETINGTCYALVGFHISSKVLPDWLWATFEPNSSITNPNRCDPKLYNSCFDPWGTTSSQPYSKGQPVPPQSQQLKAAMAAAGLNKAFNNYYLTGTQTQFVSNGKPIGMGNSFVEFNAQVPPGQASCITCHRYAYFDGKKPAPGNPEDNFGGAPSGWPNVGYACNKNQTANCTPVVPNSTSQDFSWMLGLMPY
ncbi:MAG: hypothetical protein ABW221_22665 [Vicinamibacteria bacterium]